MRGINFYNKIMWSCGIFGIENTRMTYTMRKAILSFRGIFTPKELKMENMTNKILQFWSWIEVSM